MTAFFVLEGGEGAGQKSPELEVEKVISEKVQDIIFPELS
jgi:hypothetical protein